MVPFFCLLDFLTGRGRLELQQNIKECEVPSYDILSKDLSDSHPDAGSILCPDGRSVQSPLTGSARYPGALPGWQSSSALPG